MKKIVIIKNKRASIWVETVIYTLIAFVLIGAVLAFVKPKIEEIQDKAIIDQSLRIMSDIDSIVSSIIQGGMGNKRELSLSLKKGELQVDSINDNVIFEIESKYIYSQPGEDVDYGNIIARTEKKGKYHKVTLTSNYSGYNLTYQKKDEAKSITKAAIPYKLSVTNKGKIGIKTNIDMEFI